MKISHMANRPGIRRSGTLGGQIRLFSRIWAVDEPVPERIRPTFSRSSRRPRNNEVEPSTSVVTHGENALVYQSHVP